MFAVTSQLSIASLFSVAADGEQQRRGALTSLNYLISFPCVAFISSSNICFSDALFSVSAAALCGDGSIARFSSVLGCSRQSFSLFSLTWVKLLSYCQCFRLLRENRNRVDVLASYGHRPSDAAG